MSGLLLVRFILLSMTLGMLGCLSFERLDDEDAVDDTDTVEDIRPKESFDELLPPVGQPAE